MAHDLNIKETTDAVFLLSEKLFETVEIYAAEHPDFFSCPNPGKLYEDEGRITDAISEMLLSSITDTLHSILPEAAIWQRMKTRPNAEYTWVISPFVWRLMGQSFTSIALMHHNDLLLGAYLNYKEAKITSGEKGDGAFTFEEQHTVSDADMQNGSVCMMHYSRKKRNHPKTEQHQLYKKLVDGFDAGLMTNDVIENLGDSMISVARQTLSFVIGSEFHFADVAAAACVVEAAGGVVADFDGNKTKLFTGEELFCGNKPIYQRLINIEQY